MHEAYLRMVGPAAMQFADRAHFFSVAATAMRHILVDHARRRKAARRGGDILTVVLDAALTLPASHRVGVVALDDALNRLAALNARQATMV